jgi:hypothetical protein
MLGSKLSADSGAKTRLGFRAKLDPSIEFIPGIGISAINPRGLGTASPGETFSPLLSTRFVRSAHSEIPFFRRTHVSAFNFCMSLFR